jgi:hypothetical protein
MEKYKSDLSHKKRAIIRHWQNIYQKYSNRVKVHSFPYKMTLKSSYLVQPSTFCDALSTGGWLQLTSQKCSFWVLFWWVRAEKNHFSGTNLSTELKLSRIVPRWFAYALVKKKPWSLDGHFVWHRPFQKMLWNWLWNETHGLLDQRSKRMLVLILISPSEHDSLDPKTKILNHTQLTDSLSC